MHHEQVMKTGANREGSPLVVERMAVRQVAFGQQLAESHANQGHQRLTQRTGSLHFPPHLAGRPNGSVAGCGKIFDNRIRTNLNIRVAGRWSMPQGLEQRSARSRSPSTRECD